MLGHGGALLAVVVLAGAVVNAAPSSSDRFQLNALRQRRASRYVVAAFLISPLKLFANILAMPTRPCTSPPPPPPT